MKTKNLPKKIIGIILPMLIYFIVQTGVVFIAECILGAYYYFHKVAIVTAKSMIYSTLSKYILLLNLIAGIISIPIFAFLMKRDIDKERKEKTFKRYEKVNYLKYLLIIPFGLFSMEWANMFVSILQMFMPDFMLNSYTQTEQAIYGSSIVIQIMAAGIIAPIVEELVFRGLVYKRLTKITDIKIAAVLSAVLFGVYHNNWVQAPYAFIIGLLAVFLYERYKSVVAPILFHMSANLTSVILSMALTGNTSDTTVHLSTIQLLISLAISTLIFMVLSFIVGLIIKITVHPKEEENEVINSSNTML